MIIINKEQTISDVYAVEGGWVFDYFYEKEKFVYGIKFISFLGNVRKINTDNFLDKKNGKLSIYKYDLGTRIFINGVDGCGEIVDQENAADCFIGEQYKIKIVKFEEDTLLGTLLGLDEENNLGVGFISNTKQTRFIPLKTLMFGFDPKDVINYFTVYDYKFNYSFSPNYQNVLIWLKARDRDSNCIILDNPFYDYCAC